MDDAAYERLLAKRERNAHFLALDHAARHPKPVKAPRKPRAYTTTELGPCGACGRPMRRHGKTLADKPGTIPHGKGNLCKTCLGHSRYGKRRPGGPQTRPDNCGECGKGMRSHHTRLVDAPGTVSHGKGELCKGCLKRARRNGHADV